MIETATSACSVALIEDGDVIARAHAIVGRGHAERLVPMIAALPEGGRAAHILVDCGPGSFTGIRVGVAAARGLALGWGVTCSGYSATASIAAAGFAQDPVATLAVVMEGGHGEVFMQGFSVSPFAASDALVSLVPTIALEKVAGRRVIGNGTSRLTALDPTIDAIDTLPDAADAILLPHGFTSLPPRPIYGRAPDAKPQG